MSTMRYWLTVLALLVCGSAAALGAEISWPGGTVVGSDPVWLAPGAITTGVMTRDLTLTPDGDELYFCLAGAGYGHAIICVSRRRDGGWTEPATASFSGDPRWLDLEPSVAPDGSRLYFMSTRNDAQDGADDADLWYVARTRDGWGDPRPVGPPVNTELQEYFPSLTADGTLYFTRADASGRINSIWRARPDGAGGFAALERLGEEVNAGTNRFNAWVAPDESHVILSVVGLPANHGLADYWRVDRRADDTWAEPVNLGPRVNEGLGRAWSPYVTPDGATLAFMAAPVAADDGWPRRWSVLQGRHLAPGASGGIALIALTALAGEGHGVSRLAGDATPVPFPVRRGPWFGEALPTTTPELFAPGLISTGLDERDVLVHPGGGEIWHGLMDQGLVTILATRLEGGRWTEPVTVPFHRDPAFYCFEPTVSADGNRVCFLSNRAAPGQEQGRGWTNQNIFTAVRTTDGWSRPAALPAPVTTDAAEYFPSLAASGRLYFTREDSAGSAVWVAEPAGAGFGPPRRLPAAVNLTDQVYNATVAPDESWLIACVAGHAENLGPADYWISFRDDGGAWRPAVNLGTRFNGPGERAASASLGPEGRVLFFSSRRAVPAKPTARLTPAVLRERHEGPGGGSSDIWWVAAEVLDEFRSRE